MVVGGVMVLARMKPVVGRTVVVVVVVDWSTKSNSFSWSEKGN